MKHCNTLSSGDQFVDKKAREMHVAAAISRTTEARIRSDWSSVQRKGSEKDENSFHNEEFAGKKS